MKMMNLYPNIIKEITDIFTGNNNLNMSECTLRIITPAGQQIFESKISQQTFETDFIFNHKGPCFIQIIDICSQIIDVRKIFLE